MFLLEQSQWQVYFERTRNTFEVENSGLPGFGREHNDPWKSIVEHSSIRILHWHVWLTNLTAGSSPGGFFP